jgi:excisionase family DNA binding protein
MPEPLLLKPTEAAESLRVSRAKVYAMLAAGELPSVRVGRFRRIPVLALRQWVEKRSQVGGAGALDEVAGARGEQR